MDWEEAAALGEIIEIRDAWCVKHGRVRPEMFAFPFTVTDEYLRTFPPVCGARGCEESIQLDAAVTDQVHPSQHRIVSKIDGGESYLVHLRAGNVSVGITPEQPDRPSGAADANIL